MKRTPSFLARHALLAYFALCFAIAWIGIVVAVGARIPGTAETIANDVPFVFLAMLAGPSLASIAMVAAIEGRAGLVSFSEHMRRFRAKTRWFVVALFLSPIVLGAILVALSRVAPAFTPELVVTRDRGALVAFAAGAGLCAGFFEELGWTGFATPRLLARHGTVPTGLLLGAIWAVWHGLADYWGGHAFYGSLWPVHALEWLVALCAYRVLMTWVYEHTESLFVAMLMHASFTGSQALLGPSATSVTQNLVWYMLFALGLWIVVASVRVVSKTSPFTHGPVPVSRAY